MPKPILKPSEAQKSTSINLNAPTRVLKLHDPILVEKALRKKRSPEYMEAIKNLDIAGTQMDKSAYDIFVSAMAKEFPELVDFPTFKGILGKCYIGPEYEVHSLDVTGNIVHHYKFKEPLPPDFEKARNLAASGVYEFIEVYADSLRAVMSDGTVSVIK
jgi:hypothetical protein